MGDPSELERRICEATGASRELDGLLWKALTDKPGDVWEEIDGQWYQRQDPDDPVMLFEAPALTSSIDAALTLVSRKLPGWRISIDQMKDGWDADLSEPGNRSGVFSSTAPTPALAICIALIRALATHEPTNGN